MRDRGLTLRLGELAEENAIPHRTTSSSCNLIEAVRLLLKLSVKGSLSLSRSISVCKGN
ncbi:hypothetical protein ISS96_03315 [Candidatus Bathyarchaeota archaeon]|nr:hypothetical protein [Candidatus Bathyarchaeota archaeon]